MQFGLAFRYLIDRHGGWTNLLLVTVCFLIPAIGPIVLMGYKAKVAEALIRDPEMRRHPLFTFDRFVEYLTRGIWAFLIGLILSVPFIFLLMGALILGFVLQQQVGGGGAPILVFVTYGLAYLVGLPLFMAVSIPMTFHAELTARFEFGAAFRFAVAFWKLVPGPAIMTGFVFVALSTVLSIAGLLLCFVGIYPAQALITMAAQHLMTQLYLEYLLRGGEPLVKHVEAGGDVLQAPDDLGEPSEDEGRIDPA